MKIKLAELQNFVTDLGVSRVFYENVLGLKIRREGEGWLSFELDGLELILMKGPSRSTTRTKYGDDAATSIVFFSEDIEADSEFLKSKGVRSFGEIEITPQGKLFPFADPDGNLFELIQ